MSQLSFAPLGLCGFPLVAPRLAPGAVFLRRFAAVTGALPRGFGFARPKVTCLLAGGGDLTADLLLRARQSQEAIAMRGEDQAGNWTKDANASVRRHMRTLHTVPVTLRHLVTGGILTTRGISIDISEGGIGALLQGVLRVGETVEMDFHLHERALRAVGIVRHSCSTRSGFEFLGLTAEERQQIADLMGHA